jgi:hypothetical protein
MLRLEMIGAAGSESSASSFISIYKFPKRAGEEREKPHLLQPFKNREN